MSNRVRIFITRYALITGAIQQAYGSTSPTSDGYVIVDGDWRVFKLGRDAFLTLEEACEAAEQARRKKLASHTRSADRLRSMSFASAEVTNAA